MVLQSPAKKPESLPKPEVFREVLLLRCGRDQLQGLPGVSFEARRRGK